VATVAADLAMTLGRVEAPALEFKREPKDRNAIRQAICALANDLTGQGGGDLLIGVDRDGTPYPVDTSDEAVLKIAQFRDEGRLLDRPSMTVDRAVFDGADIIRVHVNASGTPPVRFDGVAGYGSGPSPSGPPLTTSASSMSGGRRRIFPSMRGRSREPGSKISISSCFDPLTSRRPSTPTSSRRTIARCRSSCSPCGYWRRTAQPPRWEFSSAGSTRLPLSPELTCNSSDTPAATPMPISKTTRRSGTI
jgi:hypothetical protein